MQPLDMPAGLPAESLRRFGEHFIQYGRDLVTQAEFLEREAEKARVHRNRMRARRGLLLDAWQLVEQHRAAGMTHDQAVAAAARATGLPAEHVEIAWRQAGQRNNARARERRDVEIMRLRREGWTDAEIGRRVALHPKTVSRIISRQLDQARPTRPFMARWSRAAE